MPLIAQLSDKLNKKINFLAGNILVVLCLDDHFYRAAVALP